MASITIRNLDEAVKRRLRMRASEHGRSMEEEVREILRSAVAEPEPPRDLARAIR
ncbi:MAG: plasmid stabilization protein, partial [Pseudomonadales bacterium]|nr:plasmid stabilization protein [Pseudomonadales bacterium]